MFQQALNPRAFFRLSPAARRAQEPGRSIPDLVQKGYQEPASTSHSELDFLQYVGTTCLSYLTGDICKLCFVCLINEKKKADLASPPEANFLK